MSIDETKEKLTVHVKLFAKAGKLEALLKELSLLVKSTREEPGCEYSEILQNIDDPLLITIVDKFTHYRAFKDHMQMPATRRFIDQMVPELIEKTHVSFHMTRIDCIGNQGQPNVEKLSFREDCRDRH